jgi:hypothetical protein
VNIGVVVGYRRRIGSDEPEGGGLGQDTGFELVVLDEEIAAGAGYEVGFLHKLLGFSGLYVVGTRTSTSTFPLQYAGALTWICTTNVRLRRAACRTNYILRAKWHPWQELHPLPNAE